MGVHHFKLSLLPKAYFQRIGLPVPSVLTAEDIDLGESVDTGWWSSLQPSEQAVTRLRRLCPADSSWGEPEAVVTTEPWGSDLRIWREQGRVWLVTFRFSPSADARALLDQFVAIARDEQCLLLDGQTGALFEPDDRAVSERLESSRAMRLVRDTRGAIIEASRETQQ